MNYTWNWVMFILYCLAMLLIGYWGYKKTRDMNDYYVAGRSFGLGVAVPLFAAAFISSATMVGYTGFAYGYGWSMLAMYGIGVAGGWIALQIFAPRIYNSKCTWYTTPDLYCERYYDEGFMRIFMAFFNIILMLIYVVIGLMGIGTIMEVFLKLDYFWAVIIVSAVFLIYTTFGGMFSVAWTNVVQFILLFVGIIVAAVVGINMAGGLSHVNAAILDVKGGITQLASGAMHSFTAGGKLPLTKIFGIALGITLICPSAVYYQRMFFSVRSRKVAGSFIGISAILLMIAYVGIVLIGISARVLLPNLTKTEQAFPSLINMMPVAIGALIVAGIISAVQSTMDSQLLAAGSMATNDIYNKLMKKNATEQELMNASRWLTLAIGIVAMVIALIRPGLVIDLYNFIMVLGPTVLFPPLVLGLFWKRTTREAGIFGAVFGFVAGLAWIFLGPKNIPATLVIVPISIILMVVISLATSPPPKAVVEKFFDVA